MGRGQKRGRDGGGFADQYGEGMISQDRADRHPSGTGGGFKGGGSAGGGVKGRDVQLVRAVPKFLQGHMHLLGRKPQAQEANSEDEAELPAIVETKNRKDDDDDEDDEDQEDLEKAVMDNPELANEFPELKDVANRVKANAAKEKGNQAFAAKDYQLAIQHFTEALQHRTEAVYFSNRAAARYALKDYRESVNDAKQVVILDKKWVKGWSRLGAGLFAMEEWSEAKDAYTKAAELEPDDASIMSMLYKCEVQERKQEDEGKVKFKASRQKPGQGNSRPQNSTAKKKAVLSFDAEED